MARDCGSSEFATGALWPGREGGSARVLASAAGYVSFVDQDGRVDVLHLWTFRQRYTSPSEARRSARLRFLPADVVLKCCAQFSMSVANLANFHAFWSPALKRMFARSANVSPSACNAPTRGRPALPPDAVHIGTYAQPVSADAFFEDLNDVLATEGSSGNPAL